jgi:hypothetical protein
LYRVWKNVSNVWCSFYPSSTVSKTTKTRCQNYCGTVDHHVKSYRKATQALTKKKCSGRFAYVEFTQFKKPVQLEKRNRTRCPLQNHQLKK